MEKLLSPILFADMEAEMQRAVAKHGIQRTPLNRNQTEGSNLKVLVEEIGEVARALTYDEGDPRQLEKELLQVAVMAGAWYLAQRGYGVSLPC